MSRSSEIYDSSAQKCNSRPRRKRSSMQQTGSLPLKKRLKRSACQDEQKSGEEDILYESSGGNETSSPPIIRFGKVVDEELNEEVEPEEVEVEPEEIEIEPEEDEPEEVEVEPKEVEAEPEEVEVEPEEVEVEPEEIEPEEVEVEPEEVEPEELLESEPEEVELDELEIEPEEEPEELEVDVEPEEVELEELEIEPEEEPEELEVDIEPEEVEHEQLESELEETDSKQEVIEVEGELEIEFENLDSEEVELEEDFLKELYYFVKAEHELVTEHQTLLRKKMGLLNEDLRRSPILKREALQKLKPGTKTTKHRRKCVAPNNEVIYQGQKGVLNADQERRAKKLMSQVQAGNPAFLKVITASSLTSKCGICIPRKFSAEQLPEETWNVVLCQPKKEMTWPVKYYYRKHCQTFEGSPWRKFVLDNNLQEGDVCMFEMIKSAEKITFVVHISRAR